MKNRSCKLRLAGGSTSKYNEVLNKILDDDFIKNGTNIINGKTVKLFFNSTDDAYKYYSKVENNQYLFAKIVDNEALMITFSLGADITISSAQTYTKQYIVDEKDLNLINTKDE